MAYKNFFSLEGQVFLLDYELTRQDSFGYNFFSYKILNTLIVFRSAYPLLRYQPVYVNSVVEAVDSIVIEIMPYDGVDEVTMILSAIAYKVPLDLDFNLEITDSKNVDVVYSIVDADAHNSKVGFVSLMDKHATGVLEFPIEGDFIAKLQLTH